MAKGSNRSININGNVEKLTQIGEVKGNVFIQQGQDAEKALKNSVQLVRVGAYEQAINTLTEVIKAVPLMADAYYYFALASLKGKRPKSLTLAQVKVIEQNLQTACEINNKEAHYYYLWAIVKYDFYIVNGFMLRPPRIEDLLLMGRQSSHKLSSISEMLENINGVDDNIIKVIVKGM